MANRESQSKQQNQIKSHKMSFIEKIEKGRMVYDSIAHKYVTIEQKRNDTNSSRRDIKKI